MITQTELRMRYEQCFPHNYNLVLISCSTILYRINSEMEGTSKGSSIRLTISREWELRYVDEKKE